MLNVEINMEVTDDGKSIYLKVDDNWHGCADFSMSMLSKAIDVILRHFFAESNNDFIVLNVEINMEVTDDGKSIYLKVDDNWHRCEDFSMSIMTETVTICHTLI